MTEDTLTVARTMRAASPPASAADILEANANNRRANRPGDERFLFSFFDLEFKKIQNSIAPVESSWKL